MASTKPMDKMKDLLGYFLAAMAMFALLCAIYEAMNQRIEAALALGGLFLVAVLLFYLPQLEVIKAFGVEAKMRETLNEAQEIIGRMKNLAEANAEATYGLIAWGNRWSGMPLEEKQKIVNEIDLQLKSLGATDEDLRKLKSTAFIPLIGYDIKEVFEKSLTQYVMNINTLDGNAWVKNFQQGGWLELQQIKDMNGSQLTEALNNIIPRNLIRAEDIRKFNVLANKIGELYTDCLNSGGYTPHAIDFLNKFRNLTGDRLLTEALNQN
jgi:hypothetical protein